MNDTDINEQFNNLMHFLFTKTYRRYSHVSLKTYASALWLLFTSRNSGGILINISPLFTNQPLALGLH